jgi:hypothetical protein
MKNPSPRTVEPGRRTRRPDAGRVIRQAEAVGKNVTEYTENPDGSVTLIFAEKTVAFAIKEPIKEHAA